VFPVLLAAATPLAKATAAAATAAAATAAPIVPQLVPNLKYQPQTALQQHAGWLTHGFAGIFILSALLLIVMLAIQTTKQEGLSGTLGGRVDSAYRGRLGFEGQIARITGIVAVTFVIVATLVSLSGI
jgi:preprotein translocase subunit SecG